MRAHNTRTIKNSKFAQCACAQCAHSDGMYFHFTDTKRVIQNIDKKRKIKNERYKTKKSPSFECSLLYIHI